MVKESFNSIHQLTSIFKSWIMEASVQHSTARAKKCFQYPSNKAICRRPHTVEKVAPNTLQRLGWIRLGQQKIKSQQIAKYSISLTNPYQITKFSPSYLTNIDSLTMPTAYLDILQIIALPNLCHSSGKRHLLKGFNFVTIFFLF